MRRLVALVLLVALTATARAGNWSTPAAGASGSGGPEVLFTFDDGPNHKTTAQVLDVLAKHRIQAVFFMLGEHFQREDPRPSQAIMKRVVAEGHIVANHSVTHQQLCTGKPEMTAWEIDKAQAILEQEAGMPVTWFRAPYGAWCPRLVRMFGERGLTHFYWDIDPQEWRTRNVKTTIWKVTWALKRLQGRAVVLLHDIKWATVWALPKILEWIDAENVKRAATGAKQIRVIGAPEYAAELFGLDRIAAARELADEALGGLAAALASTVP